MIETLPQQPNTSFLSFIWSDRRNRMLLLLALGGTILQFIIFKLLYPYPDFFSDSYSYLFVAYAHMDIGIWPIGYSKFLFWFHYITYSSTALITFQYFLLELSAACFFFSFLYLFRVGKIYTILLFIFLFFNPLFLYISNYINSDPLFAALSLFWFTQLLWILHKPRPYQLFVQAILLFLCFTVRNNAYYYPIISALCFLQSKQNLKLKLAGIALPLIFIIPFISHTRNVAYQITGSHQYSLFTGWQLANNALYMRQHIQVDSTKLPNKETRTLDRLANQYFSHFTPKFDDYLTAYVANYFIRTPDAPLKKYFGNHFDPQDGYESVVDWGKASIVFDQYGSYLIKQYPIPFIRYYLLRNTRNYFMPPLEKLEIYNLGQDEVEPIAEYWFHFKNTHVIAISKEGQGKILWLYPLFFLFINLLFFFYLTWTAITEKRKLLSHPHLLIAIFFWAVNLGFSIFATINVFRYQFVPMLICVSFSILLLEITEKKEFVPYLNPSYAK